MPWLTVKLKVILNAATSIAVILSVHIWGTMSSPESTSPVKRYQWGSGSSILEDNLWLWIAAAPSLAASSYLIVHNEETTIENLVEMIIRSGAAPTKAM